MLSRSCWSVRLNGRRSAVWTASIFAWWSPPHGAAAAPSIKQRSGNLSRPGNLLSVAGLELPSATHGRRHGRATIDICGWHDRNDSDRTGRCGRGGGGASFGRSPISFFLSDILSSWSLFSAVYTPAKNRDEVKPIRAKENPIETTGQAQLGPFQ